MHMMRLSFPMLAALVLSCSCATSPEPQEASSFSQTMESPAERPLERVVMARRTALTRKPIDQPLSDAQIKGCVRALSKCALDEQELFLSPFSDYERALMESVAKRKAPIVSRTRMERLRSVLKSKALMSPRYAASHGVAVKAAFTPKFEQRFFGAYSCVFATVGPPDGTPSYGEVAIRLKQSVAERGWATPWSGFDFIANTRTLACGSNRSSPGSAKDCELKFDDLPHFAMYIVDGPDWSRALGCQCVLFLRRMRESGRYADLKSSPAEFVAELLKKGDRDFWRTLSDLDACYLEAKFSDMVPSDCFESIEVPPERLAEVLSWPESEPFRQIIRASGE